MTNASCASCSAPVTNPSVSGVLCDECYGRELEADSSSGLLRSPASLGALAALAPFAFHLEVNGLDYVRVVAGAIAILAGLATLVAAAKAHDMVRAKIFFLGMLVLAGGAYHLFTSGLM